jgi:class 3 adenylate cyclase
MILRAHEQQPTTAPTRQPKVWNCPRCDALRADPDARVRLTDRYLAAVDIEGFSSLSALDQVYMQEDLGRVLDIAAARTGFDRTLWQVQERGDGELAVLPPDVEGPRLICDYPRELANALGAVNNERRNRLRIRTAIHHGSVVQGRFGPVGQGPIVVSRLLDSDGLRRYLAQQTEIDLVLIVSASLYNDMVESHLCRLDPAQFARADVLVKGRSYSAYILNTGHYRPLRKAFQRTQSQLIAACGREASGAPRYLRVTRAVVGSRRWNRLRACGVHRRLPRRLS